MNGAQLAATFEANKVPVMAAAAAGVVGLALVKRKSSSSSSSPSTSGAPVTTTQTPGASSYYSTGGQTAGMSGGGVYDSTSSDLFGAISPQLESLGQQVTALQSSLSSPSANTVPVPAPTTNQAWQNSVVQAWTNAGQNPLDMQTALSQYLAGQPLNTAQASGISWAIQHAGTAPQGPSGNSYVVPVPSR